MSEEEIERAIVTRAIVDALRAGLVLAVDDGAGIVVSECTDKDAVLGVMFSAAKERLLAFKDGRPAGWVDFVYGYGCDVLSDYSASLERVLSKTNTLAESYA